MLSSEFVDAKNSRTPPTFDAKKMTQLLATPPFAKNNEQSRLCLELGFQNSLEPMAFRDRIFIPHLQRRPALVSRVNRSRRDLMPDAK
jgi:hypothetical protein